MIDSGPLTFAQADQEHLHQPALDVAREPRVRLDAVDYQHVVGLVGAAVEVDREAFAGAADDYRLHRGADRAADELLGDPIGLDERPLTFRGAAGVTSHGRNDEGLGPQPREMRDGRAKDEVHIGHPAAAGGDRHGLSRLDPLGQLQPGKLGRDLSRNVRDPAALEALADAEDFGIVDHRRTRLLIWILRPTRPACQRVVEDPSTSRIIHGRIVTRSVSEDGEGTYPRLRFGFRLALCAVYIAGRE